MAQSWEKCASGISYCEFRLEGPNRVFVARADRSDKNWVIETCIAQGKLRSGLETVSGMARRYHRSVNFDGNQYNVHVAINGDYFDAKTQQPPGGQITDGWLVKRFANFSGGSGFIWCQDRSCFPGGNVTNRKSLQSIAFEDATSLRISNINTARGKDKVILYTPHFDRDTHTDNSGVEVLVVLDRRLSLVPKNEAIAGRIVSVRPGAGSTPIPFDHVVISGHGSGAEILQKRAQPGRTLHIYMGVIDHGLEDLLPRADWSGARASLSGHFYCVIAGKVFSDRWARNRGATARHPRTCIAMNDRYVYFVVVDGRSDISRGITITELGEFCRDGLNVTYAIAQDGGGSSTMWVGGKVRNVPSDGQERPVANGYMMAELLEPQRSSHFRPGDSLLLEKGDSLHLGPGTDYSVMTSFDKPAAATILNHRLNGVLSKGAHWWQCRAGEWVGWVVEKDLHGRSATSSGPHRLP